MLKKLRVSTKIILPIVIILSLGNIITNYITSKKMNDLAKNTAIESLEMLSSSIFITLRNAMNTGDPIIIKKAENDSRDHIKGLTNLTVAKSQKTIDMYSPGSPFTNDPEIVKTFQLKKQRIKEDFKDNSHFLRVLKPMIATQECLLCHANQQKGDVIGVIDLTFSLDEAEETISEAIISILLISLSIIFVTLVVVWYVAKKSTDPLKNLKKELNIFFSFLAHETKTIEPFKVHSLDEIGEMVISLNENIEKTKAGLDKDIQAIKESSQMCADASRGNLSVNISSRANNPEINNLTQIVNELLSSLNYNINRTLKTLNSYSQDEYAARINSKGNTTGEIKKLFEQVDFLGDTLTKLSSQNLKNGKALQQTSQVFAKNVQALATSSKEQASSLNETSKALNNITANIQQTTQNSEEMAKLASSVESSSKKGHDLANKTATSMQTINEKVEAINEAITIIDQIAFQTNILSLNAAVESATAGEAGKGFAVVAGEVRNLAARSTEAAKEIKNLVEDAALQTSEGKTIAKEMIEGYVELDKNIKATNNLIDSVKTDSNEQKHKIEEINSSIVQIDNETQNNAKVAQETNIVAQQASDIAQKIVDDAGDKKFTGKDNIKIRKKIIDPSYKGEERRKIEKNMKS